MFLKLNQKNFSIKEVFFMHTIRTIEAKITTFWYFGSQKLINFVRP
jgi:hypothetical protein